jgi:hypothetical protein
MSDTIEWRGLELPASSAKVLDVLAEKALRVFPIDVEEVYSELLQANVPPVKVPDPGLMGLRMGQVQGWKDRLSNLHQDVSRAHHHWKKMYEAVSALALSTMGGKGSAEERAATARTLYIRKEYEEYAKWKELLEAIVFRQTILAQEGEVLSRQISAIQLQLTLMDRRGASIDNLVWGEGLERDSKEQAGRARGQEE